MASFDRSGGVVVETFGHTFLELFLRLTNRTSELWQLGAAKNDKNDDQNDDELCCPEIHSREPSPRTPVRPGGRSRRWRSR